MTPSTKSSQLKSSSFLSRVKFVNCPFFVPDFAQCKVVIDLINQNSYSPRSVITAYCILKPWSQFSQQFDANVVLVVFGLPKQ